MRRVRMNNQTNTSKSSIIYIIIAIIIILIGVSSCNSCTSSTSSSSSKSRTCQICHKTFTNSDDVNSILWTNMCENCYSNYKFSQDLKEEIKKYDENN